MRDSLLPLSSFDPILEVLANRRVLYVPNPGNVGDQLIERGTMDFFTAANTQASTSLEDVDLVVFSGGGNLGRLYENPAFRSRAIRQSALKQAMQHAKQCVILPQTYTGGTEALPRDTVLFVRDRVSHFLLPGTTLAPDMALFWQVDRKQYDEPSEAAGLFLREDTEANTMIGNAQKASLQPHDSWSIPNLGDPVKLCKTAEDYLRLATRYNTIVTNRLHFAIAALILGRTSILLPNSYYKNRAMYETWLRDLGCLWADDIRSAAKLLS